MATVNPIVPPNQPETPDPRWFWISLGQYLVLGFLGALFAYFLVYGVLGSDGKNMERLADPEIARGVITYLVAVATVAIATMLVMAAIMSGGKDLDKRFALGKEVLTLLIGVLGTIIGFYYGSTVKGSAGATEQAQTMQVADVKFSPDQPQIAKPFNLGAAITGGTPPYTYTIRFHPNVVTPPVENEISTDGKINRDFNISDTATPATPVDFVIEVKDKYKKAFTYNKDNKQKVTLKAP